MSVFHGGGTVSYNLAGKLPGFYIQSNKKQKKRSERRRREMFGGSKVKNEGDEQEEKGEDERK